MSWFWFTSRRAGRQVVEAFHTEMTVQGMNKALENSPARIDDRRNAHPQPAPLTKRSYMQIQCCGTLGSGDCADSQTAVIYAVLDPASGRHAVFDADGEARPKDQDPVRSCGSSDERATHDSSTATVGPVITARVSTCRARRSRERRRRTG